MTCDHASVVDLDLVPGDQPILLRRCVGCGYRIREISSSTEAYRDARSYEEQYAREAWRRYGRAPAPPPLFLAEMADDASPPSAGFFGDPAVANPPAPQSAAGPKGTDSAEHHPVCGEVGA